MVGLVNSQVHAALALVDAYLEAERIAHGWAGLSAAVILDQSLIWSAGHGHANVEARTPATPDTLYSVASVTKLFTVTMLMQLRDAGRVQLDDPVAQYDPTFVVRSPFPTSRPITFRHLASHTSGLPKDFPFAYWDDDVIPPIDALLATLPEIEPAFPPMTAFKYCNIGMACLGHALELIAGQPYLEYVTEHILRPLGMDHATFVVTDSVANDLALGYMAAPQDMAPTRARYFPGYNIGGLVATGGLYTSVTEIARFMALQFRDGPVGGAQILDGTTLREMHAPVLMRDTWERAVGLGWLRDRVAGETTIGHPGDHSGFTAEICLVPDLKIGLAIFINSNGNLAQVTRDVGTMLFPVVRSVIEAERRSQQPPAPSAWNRYVGTFSTPSMNGPLEIRLIGGVLTGHSRDLSGEIVTFDPVAESVFRQRGGFLNGERVVFEADEDGQIIRMRYNGFTRSRVQN